MNFIEFVGNKAQQCGWQIARIGSESFIQMTFKTDMGDENCYVQPVGKNSDGNTIIEFSSDGLLVPDNVGEAAILSLALLERNGNMLFGYWGIEKLNSGNYYTVFARMIANTMDADEFKGAVTAVVNERSRVRKEAQKNIINF